MKRTILCRNATTFARNGDIDEDAFRAFMQRFVDADVGVYIGTAGSGESHALSRDELFRLYSIGVEVCRGKVPVNANPPEQHTAKATLEQTLVAAKAGVDVVNIYGPAAGTATSRPSRSSWISLRTSCRR
ncbi:MAG: dihydrodipicolinate synthase family protein [Bauldia sp.]